MTMCILLMNECHFVFIILVNHEHNCITGGRERNKERKRERERERKKEREKVP